MVLQLLVMASIACSSPEVGEVAPIGTAIYLNEMWTARALTVAAGLDEASVLYADDAREDARSLIEQVYTGSFEPELERAVRQHLSPRTATELEYGFGRLLVALERPRNAAAVERVIEDLKVGISAAAQSLDRAQVVIGE